MLKNIFAGLLISIFIQFGNVLLVLVCKIISVLVLVLMPVKAIIFVLVLVHENNTDRDCE